MKQARGFFDKIIQLIKKPEMRILPGQLAFFLIMSLVPMIALIGAITAKLSIPSDVLTVTISDSVPKELATILNDLFSGQGLNFNIIVFFVSAFILASNGTHSMIITSNEIYKIESNDYISRRIKAIIMIFILESVLLFLFLVPIFGDTFFSILAMIVKNQQALNFVYLIFRIVKYPLMIFVLYFNIKLIYVIAPDAQIPSRSTTKGAWFTTICWIIATEIYAFYVGTFARYDIFYGSVSNIIILLMWIYILSYIFVLGLGINASVHRESVTIEFEKVTKKKK